MTRVHTIEIDERLVGVAETLGRGECIDVTKNGTLLGRIVPITGRAAPDESDLIAYLENFGRTHSRGALSVRQMRDEGRS